MPDEKIIGCLANDEQFDDRGLSDEEASDPTLATAPPLIPKDEADRILQQLESGDQKTAVHELMRAVAKAHGERPELVDDAIRKANS